MKTSIIIKKGDGPDDTSPGFFFKKGTFLKANEQYLLYNLDSTLCETRDHRLKQLFKLYPYANIFEQNLGSIMLPGTLHIRGDDLQQQRKIAFIFSQYQNAKSNMGGKFDNLSQRLKWFAMGLEKLYQQPDFKSVAIPNNIYKSSICKSGNNNLTQYLEVIGLLSKRFPQTRTVLYVRTIQYQTKQEVKQAEAQIFQLQDYLHLRKQKK